MATFPAGLPSPEISGYSLQQVDPVVRTEMESGAPRARRRTTARNDIVPVVWKLTDAQFATFRTWFDNSAEAAGGAAWFTISLAVGQTGLDTVEARFRESFRAAALPGLNWEVSATLEVR